MRATSACCVVALCFAACSDDETRPPPSSTPAGPRWYAPLRDLPAGFTSVWGTATDDVWVTGSDPGDGGGGTLLHWDGNTWLRYRAGVAADFWWSYGFADGTVYFSGSNGAIVRWDSGELTREAVPRFDVTVYGIWGATPDNVWAVGGDPEGGSGGFIWRRTGGTWRELAPPAPVASFFKVFGSSASDVTIVGTGGTVLRWNGQSLTPIDTDSQEPLFTVHAAGGRAVAVGGFDLGFLIEGTSTEWQPAQLPPGTRQLFGVRVADDGQAWAVGARAEVIHRKDGEWSKVEHGVDADKTLHSVWLDPAGGVWAVGGDIDVPPFGAGLLMYYGLSEPRTLDVGGTIADAGPMPDASVGSDAGDAGDGGPSDGGDGEAGSGLLDAASPGAIACGAEFCEAGSERCCRAADGSAQCRVTCQSGEVPQDCDAASDCSSGQVCCARIQSQLGAVVDVVCIDDCVGETLCAGANDCASGESCVPSVRVSGYARCK